MCKTIQTRGIDNSGNIKLQGHRAENSREVQLLPRCAKCLNPALYGTLVSKL